jgi:cullin 3
VVRSQNLDAYDSRHFDVHGKYDVRNLELNFIKDRVYVAHHGVPTVYDLGLMLFKDNVARAARIKDRLLKMLLSLVHKERTGEVINRGLVKSITQVRN